MKIYFLPILFLIVSYDLQADTSTDASTDAKAIDQEAAFIKRFDKLSKLGIKLDHLVSAEKPWGSVNPNAAPELQQFAFMVGQHNCTQRLRGVNPSNPSKVYEGELTWFAYYALDGRAIRDEYYSMGGNGEQTRAYDSYAKEWWVTWASVPGVVQLVAEPKPQRGSFTARKEGKSMIMRSPATDSDGEDMVRTITFFDITDKGFEWKSENIYSDKVISTGSMTCKKVAGPSFN